MNETNEGKGRKTAIALFGLLVVIFIVISGLSFAGARERPAPAAFRFDGQDGITGKRVFQSYNCMGCHTMLGNGAYFAPDLTKVYEDGGPVWLRTFLSSPGTWPTEALLDAQVTQLKQAGLVDVASLEDYFTQYPHVKEAVELLGGKRTVMPNLLIKPVEISALIAFFNYSAEINTAGWPPARKADASLVEKYQAKFGLVPPQAAGAAQTSPSAPIAEVTGEQLAADLGCRSCHSVDGTKGSGPTWKGIFGSTVTLADGSTATVDEAYLQESLLNPNAKVVQGFPSNTMPSYDGQVSEAEISLLVEYIKSLR